MRVGVLAKGLLLHEKLDVELVVLCNGMYTLYISINYLNTDLSENEPPSVITEHNILKRKQNY